jgi:hypothetical protein
MASKTTPLCWRLDCRGETGSSVTPVLELANVTFRRDGKQIIDGISLTVHQVSTGRCSGLTVPERARCSVSARLSRFRRPGG